MDNLKDKINSIFRSKQSNAWYAYQFTENGDYTPEDIANKMIALYDLLKKEGF